MTKPLYFYNGTTFELVGPTTPQSPIAYQTSAPTAPATGDIWIDSDGDVDTYNRQLTRYYFVATAGQTSISGVDANGLTLAYVAGSEQVYVNGALQVRGVDYTATNGTSITGLSALAVNDVVEVFAYTAFTVGDIIPKSTIEAKGDLLAGTANTTVGRLAVGAANNILATDSTTSTGLKWIPFTSGTSTVDASVNNPSGTAWAASSGTDPAVTITTGTKALVIVSARINSAGNFNFVGYAVSGATTIAATDSSAISSNLVGYPMYSGVFLETGLTAGSNTFTMRYRCNVSASGAYDYRKITVVALP